jgi:3-hydroxyisobutyrate dehydrogenase-like beta-hydroxyacid dehydrogenase
MSDITVIGLGKMGLALARTILGSGHSVTVWNRSSVKSRGIVSEGALLASTVVAAIEASPIVLVCLNNYSTTREIIEFDQTLPKLKNRIFVQLSSGTPQEAIESNGWFNKNGAAYLDGAILGSPLIIGTDEGQIIVSGDNDAWEKCNPVLSCLCGNLNFAGTKIDSAKVLDLAFIVQRLGLFMGVFQGLLLCESAGVSLDVYESTIAADARVKLIARTIHNETFSDPVNSIKLWKEALHHLHQQAQETNTNSEVLDFIEDKFQRAETAGIEEEDLAALIKLFRVK